MTSTVTLELRVSEKDIIENFSVYYCKRNRICTQVWFLSLILSKHHFDLLMAFDHTFSNLRTGKKKY